MDLEVIVVSHGAPQLLRRCLTSLREHPPAGDTLVTVVDSGSPDATPDMVEREFPEARLLRRANVGFSAANNIALRESEADAVLLLNPDAEIRAGALDAALRRLETSPEIGMVGVKLVTESGELDHACKRSFPTPLSALAHFTGLGRGEGAGAALSQYRATHLGEDEPGEVDAVNGAFMLCRAEAVTSRAAPAAPAGRRARRSPSMVLFYRRFEAHRHNLIINAAVYLGTARNWRSP